MEENRQNEFEQNQQQEYSRMIRDAKNEFEQNQQQEYSRMIRDAKKEEEKKKKKEKAKARKIKKWIYCLMLSVVGFIPAVIILDVYAIFSLFSKKSGKMKIWDWGILVFANFILAIILIVGFIVIYCVANPGKCWLEIVK